MAKIDTLEFTIDGEEYKFNINIGKAGWFRCNVNRKILDVLGVDEPLDSKTLDELKNKILPKYKAYLESKKIEETFILINYEANGHFVQEANREDGVFMCSSSHKDFYDSGFSSSGDRLTFDFDVYIKVTHSTGTVSWYEAQKGQGNINYDESNEKDPETWYKSGLRYGIDGVLIPYSKQAYDTLSKAREGIRGISEILFRLVSQDVKAIEAQLNSSNLIGSTNPPIS